MSKYVTKTVRLPDGRRKYIRGKTEAEAEKKVEALKKELLLGEDILSKLTVAEYSEIWLKTARLIGAQEQTARGVRALVRIHIVGQIGAMKVRDVKATHIRMIANSVTGFSRGYQCRVLSCLRGMFNSAIDDDIITKSPVPLTLKPTSPPREPVPALTPGQEEALLRAAEGYAIYPYIVIGLETGMRPGEIMALTWSDVDFENDLIHVNHHIIAGDKCRPVLAEGAKTPSGVRALPMSMKLHDYLWERKKGSTSVFVYPTASGQPHSSQSLTSCWRTVAKNLPFHTHPHQLRHTFITKLVRAGVDLEQISAVVGHSDSTITRKIYSSYMDEIRKTGAANAVRASLNSGCCTNVALFIPEKSSAVAANH